MSLPIRFAEVIEHARAGRLDEAEALLREHLKRQADDHQALHLLASVAETKGNREQAVAWIERALALAPNSFTYHAYAAELLLPLAHRQRAIDHGLRAIALKPDAADAHNSLAKAYLEMGRQAEAIACCERAIVLRPNFSDPYRVMGLALRETGRVEEAVTQFETFNRLSPAAIDGFINVIDSRTVLSNDDNNLRAVEARLASPAGLSADDMTLLAFAAAKAYDDLGRYDEAFRLLQQANASKRQEIAYDEVAALSFFERIRDAFSSDLVRARSGGGFNSDRPVFVIGMPRSGTTLVEQILASHPDVFGAGERADLPEVLVAAGVSFPEFVISASPAAFARVGEMYVERIGREAGAALRVTDKLVSNFYNVGLIHLALPNAKIIHVTRHAADTCLSCFSRLFRSGVEYSYDLVELARYYNSYAMLMRHWREVLPAGAFLDVRYEDVVSDLEGQSRRMLEYCSLDWHPDVLQFHRSRRPVTTVSLSQVRRPAYDSSVGRWRNYEKHLGPLLEELRKESSGVTD